MKTSKAFRFIVLLAMVFIVQGLKAQVRTITGTVGDGSEPLIGATVQVKGNSKVGTVTDVDGHYSINVESPGTILVFSYVGYETTERMVGSKNKIDVVMSASTGSLDEVVVVGYGQMRKSDLTGSVAQLKSEDFKTGNNLSAQQLMQGAFAGVNVAQNSGKPGGATTIRVRGGTSVNASNDPLYVIDGVPIDANAGVGHANIGTYSNDYFDQETANPLSMLNPNDIESIQRLLPRTTRVIACLSTLLSELNSQVRMPTTTTLPSAIPTYS